MMAVALTLLELQDNSRNLYLFDTFDGMTEPIEKDVSLTGISASTLLKKSNKKDENSVWCYASLQDVKTSMSRTGYERDRIHFIEGKVEDTIPDFAPKSINERVGNLAVEAMNFPIQHPHFIVRDVMADNFTQKNIFPFTILEKLKYKIHELL